MSKVFLAEEKKRYSGFAGRKKNVFNGKLQSKLRFVLM